MRLDPLTRKQKKVLNTFEEFSTERGYRPSVAELAAELDLAKSTVHFHLMALARKGYLQHREHGRGVRMLEAPLGESARIQVLGSIAAGKPLEIHDDRREELAVPRSMARGQTYALRVKGDSMIEAGILDGDLVVIRSQPTVEDGEVAVALLDDNSATLKRLYRDGAQIRLEPANSSMESFYVDRVTVQGKVVGLIRNFQ
jgi:repressor LexA